MHNAMLTDFLPHPITVRYSVCNGVLEVLRSHATHDFSRFSCYISTECKKNIYGSSENNYVSVLLSWLLYPTENRLLLSSYILGQVLYKLINNNNF